MNISKYVSRIFSITIVFIIISCNINDPESSYDENVSIVEKIDTNDWASDPVTIDTVYFQEEELIIITQYSGGCKEHTFKLIVSKAIEKSNPPIVTAFLSHDANDDTCEAWLTRELSFNFNEYGQYLKSTFGYSTAIIQLYNSEISTVFR